MGIMKSSTGSIKFFEATREFYISYLPERYPIAHHTSLLFRATKARYPPGASYKADQIFMKLRLCGKKRSIWNIRKPLVLHRIKADRMNLSLVWLRQDGIRATVRRHLELGTLYKMPFDLMENLFPSSLIRLLIRIFKLRGGLYKFESLKKDSILDYYVSFLKGDVGNV